MAKCEEIARNGDKRYNGRDDKGQIKSSVEEGASLSPTPGTRPRLTPSLGRATAATITSKSRSVRNGW